ncbi:MAG: hypothetical protein ACLFVJ_07255 [Persicimonas sp.]
MSDDRFKQARRSLIDRNKQRQQQQGGAPADHGGNDFGEDDFAEDEKTQMVNVDEMQGGRQGSSPPPRPNRGGSAPPPQDDFADAATQMVDLNSLEGSPQPPGGRGGRPGGGHGGGRGAQEQTHPNRQAFGSQPAGQQQPPQSSQRQPNQQVFSPGGGGGHEGKTDFINISDFAESKPQFAPDTASAGYEGKTDFIHLDALEGAPAPQSPAAQQQHTGSIASDQMLQRAYQFGPQSIQHGDVTLIFAQNPLGKSVVLRQVWNGDPAQMPAQMRERIAHIDTLNHPRLVKLNGVVATETGLWADLAKPEGYRLSAVLQQHGPQDRENVIEWVEQLADVLDTIHNQGLLYANLTPDAVWIQEDNSILLEPFDLLSFEHRGDLGPFGPQEMKRPPQDRQLTAATDVYSLAAVGAAALTGLPFHPEKLANLDDQKLPKLLQAGLAADPAQRPQSAGELAETLQIGGFSLDGLKNFHPAELDIKIVAAIAVLLLGGFAGYMYWNQQQAQQAAAEQAQQAAAEQAAAPVDGADEQPGGEDQGGEDQGGEDQGDGSQKAQPPGEITPDPRLDIHSSYANNPPKEATDEQLDGEDAAAEADEQREAAREHIDQAEDLRSRQDRLDEYTKGLDKLTEAIRLSGGEPTDEDKELLEKLRSKKAVRDYENEVRKRVEKAIKNDSVGEARFPYRRLSSIDYRAGASSFFDNYSKSKVRVIHKPDDDDEDGDKDK